MPTVRFRGHEFDCERGAVLRDVIRSGGETPHNGASSVLNCRGLGSCGTCAVEVTGAVSDRTRRERVRLQVPPHERDSRLRLACQTRVLGDVTVEKHGGFWGQHVDGDGEETCGDADESGAR